MTSTTESLGVTSIVLAAGKGSRMLGYVGNKTLLPLIAGTAAYEGERPLLVEVLHNLPSGPKGIVVHHFAETVRAVTATFAVSYLAQPATNGTGGALLAARAFLESAPSDRVLITMGDAPLIAPATYRQLLQRLARHDLAVLAFEPRERAQYGLLETDGEQVIRITEWKYWSQYPPARQQALRYCNAGVYAARRPVLLAALERLVGQPHRVRKQRGGQWVTIEEYFLTDIVELVSAHGHSVGFALAAEEEVMGVDTPEALQLAQQRYAHRRGNSPNNDSHHYPPG
jgi:bifunctional UDP-N-acetylglucosamine pyrophosphorylase / glucosamine-1-phosphate N-acetyltransferase